MNPNTIFDFFVTARHTIEHVEKARVVPSPVTDALYQTDDFKACVFIANAGKHSIKATVTGGGSTFADAVSPGRVIYEVTCHGKTMEVRALAERVMRLLGDFFHQNRIP